MVGRNKTHLCVGSHKFIQVVPLWIFHPKTSPFPTENRRKPAGQVCLPGLVTGGRGAREWDKAISSRKSKETDGLRLHRRKSPRSLGVASSWLWRALIFWTALHAFSEGLDRKISS